MITPTESLVFSMHANPGVYAVLAGSGVSRAAKIPTGWEITLSLVNQLAHVRQLTCEPGPEEWYRNTFGKEPDYSELLDALTGTPTERQALLRVYIEPSADERDERAKQPTAAHRAIAALAVNGTIRVILTTNFDRLIQTALEEAGVTPTVLSTPDQLQGVRPLIHGGCWVIKLHGDYRDIRIRNTQAELDSYDPKFNDLLDRILDEFGLIVCGWSAVWDGALRDALYRAPARRFTTYWGGAWRHHRRSPATDRPPSGQVNSDHGRCRVLPHRPGAGRVPSRICTATPTVHRRRRRKPEAVSARTPTSDSLMESRRRCR